MKILCDDGRICHRIIHLADIHIRIGNRESEYISVLNQFCEDISKLYDPYLIVISGDLFHNKGRLDSISGRLIFSWINRLLKHTSIILICGNHDYRQDIPNDIDMLEMLVTPYMLSHDNSSNQHYIHYLKTSGLYRWNNIVFGCLSIKDCLRPYHSNASVHVDSIPNYPTPVPGFINIALFHGTIGTSVREYSLDLFKGYDIAMLGDNHKQQIHPSTSQYPAWGYPGSLIQQDFGESLLGHGYIDWDLHRRTGTLNHVKNDTGFITVRVSDGSVFLDGERESSDFNQLPVDELLQHAGCKCPRVRIISCDENDDIPSDINKILNVDRIDHIRKISIPITHTDNEDDLHEYISRDYWYKYVCHDRWGDSTYHSFFKDVIHQNQCLIPHAISDILPSVIARNKKIDRLIRTDIPPISKELQLSYMEWKYLFCYHGETNWVDFESAHGHIVLLNGVNASGKSAMLDILFLALFGETTPSRREYNGNTMSSKIINDSKPRGETAYTRLRIQINSTDSCKYEIYRGFAHQTGKQRDHQLFAKSCVIYQYEIEDFSSKTIVAEGPKSVQTWIQHNIGSAEDYLISGGIICQSDTVNFFSLKPVDQRCLLEKTMRFDTITSFETMLSESVNGHKYISNELDAYISGLDVHKINEDCDAHNAQNIIDKIRNRPIIIQGNLIEDRHVVILEKMSEPDPINLDDTELQKIVDAMTLDELLNLTCKQVKCHCEDLGLKCHNSISTNISTDTFDFDTLSSDRRSILDRIINEFKGANLSRSNLINTRCDYIDLGILDPSLYKTIDTPIIDYTIRPVFDQSAVNEWRNRLDEFESLESIGSLLELDERKQVLQNRIKYRDLYIEYQKLDEIEINTSCPVCTKNPIYGQKIAIKLKLQKFKEQVLICDKRYLKYQKELHTIDQKLQDLRYVQSKQAEITSERQAWQTAENACAKLKILNLYVNSCPARLNRYKLNNMKQLRLNEIQSTLRRTLSQNNAEIQTLQRKYMKYQLMTELKDKLEIASAYKQQIKTNLNGVKELQRRFADLKQHLYDDIVLPKLQAFVNQFIHVVDPHLRIKLVSSQSRIKYMIGPQGERSMDNASGYQRFMIGLGMRIALTKLSKINDGSCAWSRHLMIDEGFVACDAANIQKACDVLKHLIKYGYTFVWLMSHLDNIRETANTIVTIQSSGNHRRLTFGNQKNMIPLKKKIEL